MEAGEIQGLLSGMAALPFWLVSMALLAGGLLLLRLGTRAFWRLRTLTDTPTARIQSAPQGYVELIGLALPHGGPARAPLTRTPCLWYRYRIEEQRRSGRGQRWVTLEDGESEAPFLLDDGSGRCLVEPRGAHLHSRRRDRWQGSSRDPGNRGDAGWLGALFGNSYRFTEERIESGDPLYVLGHLETPRRGPEDRERLRRALLRLWKSSPERAAALDSDGDGRISAEEWEEARARAERLAARSEVERSRAPVLPLLRDTRDSRHPFVISAHTEPELAAMLRWQALGYTAGFVGLVAVLGYGLLSRMGAAP